MAQGSHQLRDGYEAGQHPVDAVNAWSDGDDFVLALRTDGEWRSHRLSRDDADQLCGMLYLLVKPKL